MYDGEECHGLSEINYTIMGGSDISINCGLYAHTYGAMSESVRLEITAENDVRMVIVIESDDGRTMLNMFRKCTKRSPDTTVWS